MAMYRSDSSVTNQLQLSAFNTPNGFVTPMASHQQTPNFNHGVSSMSTPIGSLNQITEALSNRIDQLFGMVTSSQQALFIQQGLTAKLELELNDLRKKYSDLEKKITQSSSAAATQQVSGLSLARRVPNELSVSLITYTTCADNYNILSILHIAVRKETPRSG